MFLRRNPSNARKAETHYPPQSLVTELVLPPGGAGEVRLPDIGLPDSIVLEFELPAVSLHVTTFSDVLLAVRRRRWPGLAVLHALVVRDARGRETTISGEEITHALAERSGPGEARSWAWLAGNTRDHAVWRPFGYLSRPYTSNGSAAFGLVLGSADAALFSLEEACSLPELLESMNQSLGGHFSLMPYASRPGTLHVRCPLGAQRRRLRVYDARLASLLRLQSVPKSVTQLSGVWEIDVPADTAADVHIAGVLDLSLPACRCWIALPPGLLPSDVTHVGARLHGRESLAVIARWSADIARMSSGVTRHTVGSDFGSALAVEDADEGSNAVVLKRDAAGGVFAELSQSRGSVALPVQLVRVDTGGVCYLPVHAPFRVSLDGSTAGAVALEVGGARHAALEEGGSGGATFNGSSLVGGGSRVLVTESDGSVRRLEGVFLDAREPLGGAQSPLYFDSASGGWKRERQWTLSRRAALESETTRGDLLPTSMGSLGKRVTISGPVRLKLLQHVRRRTVRAPFVRSFVSAGRHAWGSHTAPRDSSAAPQKSAGLSRFHYSRAWNDVFAPKRVRTERATHRRLPSMERLVVRVEDLDKAADEGRYCAERCFADERCLPSPDRGRPATLLPPVHVAPRDAQAVELYSYRFTAGTIFLSHRAIAWDLSKDTLLRHHLELEGSSAYPFRGPVRQGVAYTFTQQDVSNMGHPLLLSFTALPAARLSVPPEYSDCYPSGSTLPFHDVTSVHKGAVVVGTGSSTLADLAANAGIALSSFDAGTTADFVPYHGEIVGTKLYNPMVRYSCSNTEVTPQEYFLRITGRRSLTTGNVRFSDWTPPSARESINWTERRHEPSMNEILAAFYLADGGGSAIELSNESPAGDTISSIGNTNGIGHTLFIGQRRYVITGLFADFVTVTPDHPLLPTGTIVRKTEIVSLASGQPFTNALSRLSLNDLGYELRFQRLDTDKILRMTLDEFRAVVMLKSYLAPSTQRVVFDGALHSSLDDIIVRLPHALGDGRSLRTHGWLIFGPDNSLHDADNSQFQRLQSFASDADRHTYVQERGGLALCWTPTYSNNLWTYNATRVVGANTGLVSDLEHEAFWSPSVVYMRFAFGASGVQMSGVLANLWQTSSLENTFDFVGSGHSPVGASYRVSFEPSEHLVDIPSLNGPSQQPPELKMNRLNSTCVKVHCRRNQALPAECELLYLDAVSGTSKSVFSNSRPLAQAARHEEHHRMLLRRQHSATLNHTPAPLVQNLRLYLSNALIASDSGKLASTLLVAKRHGLRPHSGHYIFPFTVPFPHPDVMPGYFGSLKRSKGRHAILCELESTDTDEARRKSVSVELSSIELLENSPLPEPTVVFF